MQRKAISHTSALFTIVSISIFISLLLMFFIDAFSENSVKHQKPIITSGQVESIKNKQIESTKIIQQPNSENENTSPSTIPEQPNIQTNETSFKSIGEGWVVLENPEVLTTQAVKNIVSRENLFKDMPKLKSHPIVPIGSNTNGLHIPSLSFPLDQNLFLYHIKDAIFTSESVLIQDNRYVLFTQACHPRYWPMFYRSVKHVNLTYKKYEYAICLGHQHSSDFGHWFLEVLPAYAIIPKEILSKSVIVVPFIKNHVIDGFNFLGISKDQLVEGDNIPFFAHHYYTMHYTFCGDLNIYLITNMRQLFIKRFNLGQNKPTEFLTFNRPNMSRCIKNYDEVRNALKKEWPNFDWKDGVYHKTLAEQAVYFDKVKFLFAVHGSVLANIIFMQDNTAIVDLQMEQWLLSFMWLTTYTNKHMIVGRDPRISWRGLAPNQIDVSYVIELVGKALKVAGYI